MPRFGITRYNTYRFNSDETVTPTPVLFEEGLVSYLSTFAITLLPLKVPEDYSLPVVTYTPISVEHETNLDGVAGIATITIAFDSWSNVYSDTAEDSELLRLALDGYRGSMGEYTVLDCQLDDEHSEYHANVDDSDLGTHQRTQIYEIVYIETIPEY